MTTKLHIVVRADLPAGSQAVQAAHAARAFAHEHEHVEKEWFITSNTLALLEVPDEPSLEILLLTAASRNIPVSEFREPDLGDSLTAIAIAPSGSRVCRSLNTALGGR